MYTRRIVPLLLFLLLVFLLLRAYGWYPESWHHHIRTEQQPSLRHNVRHVRRSRWTVPMVRPRIAAASTPTIALLLVRA